MHRIKLKITSLKFFLLVIFLSLSVYVHSQAMPAFLIEQTNGKIINTTTLKYTRPIILIYFSPDCDHCTVLLTKVFRKINQFKKADIFLVTFKPLNELIAFEKEFNTAKYKNVTVGMEQPNLFLQKFYKLESTPFTALYGSKGKLIYSYKKETSLDDLLLRLQRLK